jgi:hypothetical protein
LIPAGLWHETLAALVRMFPGVGPDSICADEGAAPPGAIQGAFDPSLVELTLLLERSRGLIVGDWRANGEVNALIRKYLSAVSAVSAASAPAASPRLADQAAVPRSAKPPQRAAPAS